MQLTKKKVTWILLAAGLAAITAVFFWSRQPVDLRASLAKALNRDPDLIFLNIPPFDGRYPGTLMFNPQPGITIPKIKELRPDLLPSTASSLRVHLGEDDKAKLSGKDFGFLSTAGNMEVYLQLDSLRMFEIDLDSSLKAKALANSDLIKDKEKNPVFIYRSYEAIPTFQIQKSSNLSASAWQQLKQSSIEAGGSLISDGSIEFKNDKPVIIAYEIVNATLLAGSLGAGSPDKVQFTQVLNNGVSQRKPDAAAAGLQPASTGVRYVCTGNAVYHSKAFGNLNLIDPSLDLATETFTTTGATALFPKQKQLQQLSQATLQALIEQTVARIKSSTDSLLIFYYAGHAISGPGGQLYLVLSDYKGDPTEDLGEESGLGIFRYQAGQSSHPLSGSNIGDLLDIVNAAQANHPKQVPGLYPVSRLYEQLAGSGKHFVILIDACYDHSQMKSLRNELNLTEWGDYYGPAEMGGPGELLRYKEAIMDFGTAPYLRSDNVVIFSAAPGTVALEVTDPRPKFGRQLFVAPLARRLYYGLENALSAGEPITWGEWLRPMIDVKPIGEVRIKGTASWSAFETVNHIPLFK